MVLNSVAPILAGLKSLAGDFAYGYDAKSPALLTKMTGPAPSVETSYPPSPRGLRSFGERSAVGGGQKAVDGGQRAVEEADSVRYYTWGRDLSGSLQGAGGVGGLLAISEGNATTSPERSTRNEEQGTNGETRFALYDANGNVGQLINTTGAVVAAYTYDPFGNVTEMAGAEAAENEWRFSTKPVEAGTGWLYYGYRWYDAQAGRWVNRDPIEESGGVNLYGFVGNDGVGTWDFLGMNNGHQGPITAENVGKILADDIANISDEITKLRKFLREAEAEDLRAGNKGCCGDLTADLKRQIEKLEKARVKVRSGQSMIRALTYATGQGAPLLKFPGNMGSTNNGFPLPDIGSSTLIGLGLTCEVLRKKHLQCEYEAYEDGDNGEKCPYKSAICNDLAKMKQIVCGNTEKFADEIGTPQWLIKVMDAAFGWLRD